MCQICNSGQAESTESGFKFSDEHESIPIISLSLVRARALPLTTLFFFLAAMRSLSNARDARTPPPPAYSDRWEIRACERASGVNMFTR